jgi:hypothetical protein
MDFSCASLLSVAPPRGSAASWHVGGLIPAEQRPRRRKVADFKQAEFKFSKFRLGRLALAGGLNDRARLSGARAWLVLPDGIVRPPQISIGPNLIIAVID